MIPVFNYIIGWYTGTIPSSLQSMPMLFALLWSEHLFRVAWEWGTIILRRMLSWPSNSSGAQLIVSASRRLHVDGLSAVRSLVIANAMNAHGTVTAKAYLYFYLQRLSLVLNGTVMKLTRLQLTILLPWCTMILLVQFLFMISHDIQDRQFIGAGTTYPNLLSMMIQSHCKWQHCFSTLEPYW